MGKAGVKMDNKRNIQKGKYGSSILLLAVLIGFCILAIIEIIYGQAQIRMEKERLALEEENHKAVQELKAEWNSLKGDPSVGAESVPEVGEEQSIGSESEKTLVNTDDSAASDSTVSDSVSENNGGTSEEDDREYAMQIVFLGDSILDANRDGTGVPYLIGETCNAKVYNMAIGGTTAAVFPGENYGFENWQSRGLLGVVHAIRDEISADIFKGTRAGEILQECDFSKTDYFIIEYGVNDFLSGQIPQSRYLENGDMLGVADVQTYAGALEMAVTMLRKSFPDAKILLIAPHYCQIYAGSTFTGDSYSLNYGYGTMVEFSRITEYVAEQHRKDNVIFYNTMEWSGIDAYTAKEYLADGVHLSEAGRRVYADYASRLIKADFYPEE